MLMVNSKTGAGDQTDVEILSDVAGGDIEAYGQIVNRYKARLYNFVYRFVGDRETAEDIVAELAPLSSHLLQTSLESTTKQQAQEHDDGDYQHLRKFLGFDPISIDELAANSGLTIDQVSSMLLILELEGEVESLSGGRYSLLGR